MADTKAELEAYPKYKALYLKAFERMLESNRQKGVVSKCKWETAEDVMEWWIMTLHGKESKAETEIRGLLDEQ